MAKKKKTSLEFGEYFDCGVLPDGSHICVRRGQSHLGPYEIIKDMPDGTDTTDIVLDTGYLTLEAAKIRAWQLWQLEIGQKVSAK